MSIIKCLQDYLVTFDDMQLRNLNEVLTDIVDDRQGSYALAPVGNNQVLEDIIGNKTYVNSYVFYAKEAAANEIDRQENYDFLDAFQEWLDDQQEAGNLPTLPGRYKADSLSVANALMMDIEEDGTGLYQLQIQLRFSKRRVG